MNERIRELAEQAWDSTAVSPDFGHPVSFAEKLSDLIVRDTIRFIEEEMHEDFANYPKWYKTVEKVKNYYSVRG